MASVARRVAGRSAFGADTPADSSQGHGVLFRMRRVASSGASRCGKWPHRGNQWSTASGNAAMARCACRGRVTKSRCPQPIVTPGPGRSKAAACRRAIVPEPAGIQRHRATADAAPGELEHHPRAHRVPNGGDPVKTLIVDTTGDGVSQRRDRNLPVQRGSLAEPRQVDGDHLAARRQAVHDRLPGAPARAETVHEQQRPAAATPDVVQLNVLPGLR